MMLRLSDLPAGFRYGDDRGCGPVGTTEGRNPPLDAFLVETAPEACFGDFNRAWGNEPRSVKSAIFVFGSGDDADRAWRLRKGLLHYGGIYLTAERELEDSTVFDSRGVMARGVGETWRDGRLVVAVYEEGLAGDDGSGFVRDLADRQRHRIESPSDPTEEDDREVGLDDPAIEIPVYWLGREFEPDGLPELKLYRGDNVAGHGPGDEVKIDYETDGGGVTLDLWRPERWKAFKATRLGKVGWSAPCARRTDLAIDGGRAEVYGGYSGACLGAPDHWLAHVYYDEVVVAVNMAYCYSCGGRPTGDPYNSREGMEAVVRGLRRR